MFKILRAVCYASVLILNFSITGIVFAADREALPLPGNTEKVNEEARSIAGSQFDFIQYESNLNSNQVRNFYRKVLADAGWKENDALTAMQQNPGFKLDKAALQAIEDTLVFEKEGETLSVNFTPGQTESGKKTGFTIARGKPDLAARSADEMDFIPRLVAKPQKEPAPVYPDAALVSLSEGAKFLQAAYASKDELDTVAKFYRNKMSGYGWDLVEDVPAKNMEAAASPEDIAKYCPDCAKKGITMPATSMLFKELVFSNGQQDKCRIGLFQVDIPAQGQASGMSFTNIMVDYEKK